MFVIDNYTESIKTDSSSLFCWLILVFPFKYYSISHILS